MFLYMQLIIFKYLGKMLEYWFKKTHWYPEIVSMRLAHLYIKLRLLEREADTLLRQLSEYDEWGQWSANLNCSPLGTMGFSESIL